MKPDETRLEELAAAILDGTPVDWVSEGAGGQGARLPLLEHLKVVAAIAAVHRNTPPALDQWAHLRVLECIGRGSFGEVFRAWDTRLDREVALKLLPASANREASSFIAEGRLLARVRHPNVVTIYGAEQIDDRIGLWMEFVRGRTLEQALQDETFSPSDTARIGTEICRAVAAVHGAGLLHRDIKAHNVMLADDGRVVLMDFGTVRELDDATGTDLSGTPLYLAPEVFLGQVATVRSDIYSLGVLLFHLVTRSYPVRASTTADMRLAHERGDRVALHTLAPSVPAPLVRVIERASHPLAERRYANADALARDLTVLQSRPTIVRFRYALIAAAALLVALVASEVRALLVGDDRSLRTRWVSLIADAPSPVQRPVIVVLPFTNLSREPGSGRLVDSLTAGLIQQLGIIDGLKVVYQQSSFALRDKPLDLASIGTTVGVNLVVKGDARLSGGTLVIQAALLPVDGGRPLWTGTLTREIRSAGDITDVLAEIARTIVNELRLTLGPTQRRYQTDIVTYEKYLRARELRDKGFLKAREAIPLFEEIIGSDPSFAPALAALAATYGNLAMGYPDATSVPMSPSEATARMEPLTKKALELDPMLADAHSSMAVMHSLARRWVDAESYFRRAIELDPTITAVYVDFVGSTMEPWGRLEESLRTAQAALDSDPLALDLRRLLSRLQLNAGKYDEALANCQRVLDLDPEFPYAEVLCARALAAKGRTTEALEMFRKRPTLNEGWIGYVYALTGRREEAEAIAARNADLPSRQAVIYAALGDKDRAFEALERLAVLNPRRAGAYLNSPEIAGLRGDPRVEALRRKMGFPLP